MESKITLSLEEWEEYKTIKDNYDKLINKKYEEILLGILIGCIVTYLILDSFMICG